MAENIRAHDPEGLLRDVPGQIRAAEPRGDRWGPRLVGYTSALQTVGREEVTIPSALRALGLHPRRGLARGSGAGALTRLDMAVGHEPATTDAARVLPAHPHMLRSAHCRARGPLLPTRRSFEPPLNGTITAISRP